MHIQRQGTLSSPRTSVLASGSHRGPSLLPGAWLPEGPSEQLCSDWHTEPLPQSLLSHVSAMILAYSPTGLFQLQSLKRLETFRGRGRHKLNRGEGKSEPTVRILLDSNRGPQTNRKAGAPKPPALIHPCLALPRDTDTEHRGSTAQFSCFRAGTYNGISCVVSQKQTTHRDWLTGV